MSKFYAYSNEIRKSIFICQVIKPINLKLNFYFAKIAKTNYIISLYLIYLSFFMYGIGQRSLFS